MLLVSNHSFGVQKGVDKHAVNQKAQLNEN